MFTILKGLQIHLERSTTILSAAGTSILLRVSLWSAIPERNQDRSGPLRSIHFKTMERTVPASGENTRVILYGGLWHMLLRGFTELKKDIGWGNGEQGFANTSEILKHTVPREGWRDGLSGLRYVYPWRNEFHPTQTKRWEYGVHWQVKDYVVEIHRKSGVSRAPSSRDFASAALDDIFKRTLQRIAGTILKNILQMSVWKIPMQLLRSTDMKTSRVAYEAGFSNPHYFSVSFKNIQECPFWVQAKE